MWLGTKVLAIALTVNGNKRLNRPGIGLRCDIFVVGWLRFWYFVFATTSIPLIY